MCAPFLIVRVRYIGRTRRCAPTRRNPTLYDDGIDCRFMFEL